MSGPTPAQTAPAEAAHRRERLHAVLMLTLTFSTGVIDAIGYLGLDRVFTGNMTGNVVILGMAVAGGDDLPVVGPTIALACFMLGAALGGRYLRRAPAGWGGRHTAAFGAVGVLLVLTAGLLGTGLEHRVHAIALTVTGLMAAAMGLQAAAARKLGLKDLTTVVVTSVITGLSADSRLGGGHQQPWLRRAGAVVLIAAGAAVGALLLRVHIGLGPLLAGLIALTAAGVGEADRRATAKG